MFLAITSCSAPAADNQTGDGSGTPVASSTASDEPTLAPVISTSGLPIKGPANDGHGDYLQTTIADDDPALTYNPAIVDPSATELFSVPEIKSLQQTLVRFIAEEAFDSTINGNPTSPDVIDAWFGRNKHKLDPSQADMFLNELKSSDQTLALVNRSVGRENRYQLSYGADQVHVLQRSIEPNKILGRAIDGVPYMALNATGTVTYSARVGGRDQQEKVEAELSYTCSQGSNGEWLIVGYQNTFYTTLAG